MVSSTAPKKLTFNPGFNKNTTEYGAENYWVDGDKVRFRKGLPEKLGGFYKDIVYYCNNTSISNFTGVARKVHAWTDLQSNKLMAVGTHQKLEMLYGSQIYDVTPYREELSLEDAITTSVGSSEVTITDANPHNLLVGERVFVDSQETAVDGITLSGEYAVTEIVSTVAFKVDSGVEATGTTSLGGDTLEINYLLEFGKESNGALSGYGGGSYDTEGKSGGGYGDPRASDGGLFLRQWSLDNWGEDGIACVRGGKIYHWDATSGVAERYKAIAGAPEQNLIVLVTDPSRVLVAFGSEVYSTGLFDPLIIRWADQETLTEWAITSENLAGEYRLASGNKIVAVVQTKGEVLIFTDSTLYSMRYVGGTDVFSFDVVGKNISCISQNCVIDVNGIVYWFGVDGFYSYNGSVNELSTSLEDYVFDQDGEGRVNMEQKEKTYCGINKEYNEIVWLYPPHSSEENSRYIMFNYLEGLWYDGTFDRTVWIDKGVFDKPYAIDSSGYLYVHEVGKDADGSPMPSFIRSGDIDIEDGDYVLFVDKFIPDFKLIPNRNAALTLYLRKFPNETQQVKGPYSFNNNTKKVNVRARARQIAIEYSVSTLGADFKVGSPRFYFKQDGKR